MEIGFSQNKDCFEIFFQTLLRVEAYYIRDRTLSFPRHYLGGLIILLGLVDPFTDIRPFFHTGPVRVYPGSRKTGQSIFPVS